MNSMLEVEGLSVEFPLLSSILRRRVGAIHAVSDVTFTLERGETLAIVGESGCGKSTLARAIVGLQPASAGRIRFKEEPWSHRIARTDPARRRQVQMVFQDPYASLNPGMSARQLIIEPWAVHGGPVERRRRRDEADALMVRVGLDPEDGDRYPHEFSGGQRQRICIARALALQPDLVVCDEPVSALDVSIQAQILNLLIELQDNLGLSYLFIAHDLAVVRQIASRVAVMYLGRIVEVGETEALFGHPAHPYTQALLSAAPDLEADLAGLRKPILLEREVPSPADPPSGCRFRTRCWKAETVCADQRPPLRAVAPGLRTACHFADPQPTTAPAANGVHV